MWLAAAVCFVSGTAVAADTEPPVIEHRPCERYSKGAAFVVHVRLVDTSAIFDPKMVYRMAGKKVWRTATLTPEPGSNVFVATVPARELRGTLEYFIEVFDEHGNGPAVLGSQASPLRTRQAKGPVSCEQLPPGAAPPPSDVVVAAPVDVAPTPVSPIQLPPPEPLRRGCDALDPPLYCSTWLWVGVGSAVAVAGGVAAWWLWPEPEREPPSGRVGLTVTGADPTQALGP